MSTDWDALVTKLEPMIAKTIHRQQKGATTLATTDAMATSHEAMKTTGDNWGRGTPPECRQWEAYGTCSFGNRCKYAHTAHNRRSSSPNNNQLVSVSGPESANRLQTAQLAKWHSHGQLGLENPNVISASGSTTGSEWKLPNNMVGLFHHRERRRANRTYTSGTTRNRRQGD